MTCTCGSTIKRSGFRRHFYTYKHMDYLIPVLNRRWDAVLAQQEEERRLQRAAAEAARAEAEALARATSSTDISEAERAQAWRDYYL